MDKRWLFRKIDKGTNRLGAVVLILKHTDLSDGFLSFIEDVTAEVKGPRNICKYHFLLKY